METKNVGTIEDVRKDKKALEETIKQLILEFSEKHILPAEVTVEIEDYRYGPAAVNCSVLVKL